MLPKEMWDLLLSYHKHVIALGDPGQLPPVKSQDNGILYEPHIFLDEIMRQAQESEIIRLTMGIREGKPLPLYNGNEVIIVDRKDFVDGMCFWADQVITGWNSTKRSIDDLVRAQVFGAQNLPPQDGDKAICRQNSWYDPNEAGDVLVNGSVGYIHNLKMTSNRRVPSILKCNFVPEIYESDWQNSIDQFDDHHRSKCPIKENVFWDRNLDYPYLTTGVGFINDSNRKKIPYELQPRQFEYGYAITCHRAQGSEYSKVLVLDERMSVADHSRWLYTAATRAKDKLVIVRNYS